MFASLEKTAFAAAVAAAALIAGAQGASAQGVDRYQFLQVEKKVDAMEAEIARLRSAIGSGSTLQRLDGLEGELARLTGQIEQLQFAVRNQEDASKRKLEDLEYRIIELEGGDPSVLFQNDEDQSGGASDQGALTPPPNQSGGGSGTPAGGGALGVITSTAAVSGAERASYDAAVAAVTAGRTAEGAQALERFIAEYPDSALTGDAHYWLGESYFKSGEYQSAANRYLDGAELFPGSPKAAESLYKFGVTIGILGDADVACSTFREVRQRYPNESAIIEQAETEGRRLGCG